jgi:cation transport regulator ChaC
LSLKVRDEVAEGDYMSILGILAYGSLIDNPGSELSEIIESQLVTTTPFNVEYARSSSSRDGAPTLAVVQGCGAPVKAILYLLDQAVSLEDAIDILFRREMHEPAGSTRKYNQLHPGAVQVEILTDFQNVSTVLYTKTTITHPNTSADELADLAIQSAYQAAGRKCEDGICYLRDMKNCGVVTAITDDYEKAILSKLGVKDLQEAWEYTQNQCSDKGP